MHVDVVITVFHGEDNSDDTTQVVTRSMFLSSETDVSASVEKIANQAVSRMQKRYQVIS